MKLAGQKERGIEGITEHRCVRGIGHGLSGVEFCSPGSVDKLALACDIAAERGRSAARPKVASRSPGAMLIISGLDESSASMFTEVKAHLSARQDTELAGGRAWPDAAAGVDLRLL